MYNSYYSKYSNLCTELKDKGILRNLQALSKKERPKTDFSSNDYLSLSCSVELKKAVIETAQKYGVGSTGSRLLSGNCAIFEQLEKQIALDKKTDCALVFSSGFQANISTLSCILDNKVLGAKPVVLFDKLNHSSLYQAVFLSGAKLIRYRHNDCDHLESIFSSLDPTIPKFLVTETVFGMDGDVLPNKIVEIAKKNNAFLYLDEAHATGVMGEHGYGLSTTLNLKDYPYIAMGTFSKALGISGGYVACSSVMKNYLINKAHGFIYTTANSPIIAGAALKAWNMIRDMKEKRQRLLSLAHYARGKLLDYGTNIGNSESHIIPIIFESTNQILNIKKQLLEKYGILVSAILPPTVPPNTPRLRVALNLSHTKDDIDALALALSDILK